jgi:uracil-DNA glycosylase
LKVVILGQDPYMRPGQAHGLCFSVRAPVRPPPSLVNVYKELNADLGLPIPAHGDLSAWARQGVLLLNSILTVRSGEPLSHANRGWERFTDRVMDIANTRERLVFLLWGRPAQEKAARIDRERHLVLTAAHPSPRSADRGFFGCRHFSKANRWLGERGMSPVDWAVGGGTGGGGSGPSAEHRFDGVGDR